MSAGLEAALAPGSKLLRTGAGRKFEMVVLALGGLGLMASLLGYLNNPDQFAQSWLMGWLYWFGIAAGSLGWLLIHHLVRGRWSHAIQGPLEAASCTLPLLLLLFLPLFLCLESLYPWLRPEVLATDALVQHKQAYLNYNGFVLRFALYGLIWIVLAFSLSYFSGQLALTHIRDEREKLLRQLGRIAAPGLVLFAVATTFAAFDWLMSLEPHWFSSIYGALQLVGQALSSLLFMVIVLYLLVRHADWGGVVEPQQFQDIGNLIFGFVILWAYMSFGQFLIIWSGNLYEESFWFLKRASGGWLEVSWALFLGQVLLPFALLMFRSNKRRSVVLAGIALVVLLFRYVDVYWQVAPGFRSAAIALHWMDLAAFLAVGGVFLMGFIHQLRRAPLPTPLP